MTANPASDPNPIMPATNPDILPSESPADSASRCPTCGEAIPPTATVGLCPKCALLGVADLGESVATRTLAFGNFEVPRLAEIAAAFPQLEILEVIGHGGMGAVYRARQQHLERTEPVAPGYNPWPRRVFWLVLTIFCVPIALLGVGLLVPLLAYQSPMHF